MASIDEAKDIIRSTPISTIVGFYHGISKRGANYEGICPFHADTKPSMKINDQKGIYKCFACGAAGDALKFVQDYKNLTFVEAIKDIGEKIGIAVEENQRKKQNPKVEIGFKVMNAANKIYLKYAKENKPKEFLDFLQKRNLNEESLKNFEIGFAPPYNELFKFLSALPEDQKTKALKVAFETGIIREGQNKSQYDFFRNRVTFPIWDHFGNVRGFSTRAISEEQKPKYLNSGESFIFDKRNILYGFKLAKSFIRQQDAVLIVEGNMDTVVLHQFGFKYAVGTMGVALSEYAAKILCGLTKNVYLAMDSDDAGYKAMIRINEIFFKLGVKPKYISFHPSKDPDDFLNEHGKFELEDRIQNAKLFCDIHANKMINESSTENLEGKLAALEDIFSLFNTLGTSLFAKEKVLEYAKKLGLKSGDSEILEDFARFQAGQKKFKPKQTVKSETIDHHPAKQHEQVTPKTRPKILSKTQLLALKQIFSHPESLQHEKVSEILDFMPISEVKSIFEWCLSIYLEADESDYANILKSKLEDDHIATEIKNAIAQAAFDYVPRDQDKKITDKLMSDLLVRLKQDQYKNKIQELKELQKTSSPSEAIEILKEIAQINSSLNQLKKNK